MKNSKFIPGSIILLIVTFMLLDFLFLSLASCTFTGLYAEIFKSPPSSTSKEGVMPLPAMEDWKINGKFDNYTNLIIFTVRDENDQFITGAKVNAKFLRTVTTSEDQLVELIETTPGVYAAKTPPLKPGRWNIRVKVRLKENELIVLKRVTIPL